MDREPFEPKGRVSEATLLYEFYSKLSTGDVVTYEQLDEILGRSFLDSRSPHYTAVNRLQKNDKKSMDVVRNVGYRVVSASEHERLALHHHAKSRRQLRKSVAKAASANRAELSQEERHRIDSLEGTLRNHASMLKRLDERTIRQNEELKRLRRETSSDVAHLSDKVERLEELVKKFGFANDVA